MRKAIVCDLNRCIGCLSCPVACKMEHDTPAGASKLRVLRVGPNPRTDGEQFPNVEMYFLPFMCQHCANPSCIPACKTGSLYKTEDGVVHLDKAKCSGCKLCVKACPYGAIEYNERDKVVEKCTLCDHLLAKGQEPTCVAQCVGEALNFGDLDDSNSTVARMVAEGGKDVHSLPDKGLQPSFKYILRKAKWRGLPA